MFVSIVQSYEFSVKQQKNGVGMLIDVLIFKIIMEKNNNFSHSFGSLENISYLCPQYEPDGL